MQVHDFGLDVNFTFIFITAHIFLITTRVLKVVQEESVKPVYQCVYS